MKKLDTALALEKALEKFNNAKWNCSESVLYGIISQVAESEQDVEKYITIISGFNGGVGGSRHLCGAISGAVGSLGILFGKFGMLKQDNMLCSSLSSEVLNRFQEHFNTVECSDLTKDFADFHSPERRINCREMVKYAINECVGIINRNL